MDSMVQAIVHSRCGVALERLFMHVTSIPAVPDAFGWDEMRWCMKHAGFFSVLRCWINTRLCGCKVRVLV